MPPSRSFQAALCATLCLALPCFSRTATESDIDRGDRMYYLGKMNEAARFYKSAIAAHPQRLDARLHLLHVYLHKNDYPAAIAECEKILAISPNHKAVLLALGNLLSLSNKTDAAEDTFERALSAGAAPAMTHHALALTLLQKGDADGAFNHCSEALKYQPKFPGAHLSMAVIETRKANFNAGIEQCDLAIKQRPNFPEAHNVKADILIGMEKWQEALTEYKIAVRQEPNYAQAWQSLAHLYLRLGNESAAREANLRYFYILRSQATHPTPSAPDSKVLPLHPEPLLDSTGDFLRPDGTLLQPPGFARLLPQPGMP